LREIGCWLRGRIRGAGSVPAVSRLTGGVELIRDKFYPKRLNELGF